VIPGTAGVSPAVFVTSFFRATAGETPAVPGTEFSFADTANPVN